MNEAVQSVVDAAVRGSLTDFVRQVIDVKWFGREHEAISLYVLGHLQQHFISDNAVLRDPTQICIQGTVPGVPGLNPKGRVNKDLVIWPPEYRSCWDAESHVTHAPLCVMEWKVFRPGSRRPKISEYDVKWLELFAAARSEFVGYAVSLNLTDRNFKLSVTRLTDGDRQDNWLRM